MMQSFKCKMCGEIKIASKMHSSRLHCNQCHYKKYKQTYNEYAKRYYPIYSEQREKKRQEKAAEAAQEQALLDLEAQIAKLGKTIAHDQKMERLYTERLSLMRQIPKTQALRDALAAEEIRLREFRSNLAKMAVEMLDLRKRHGA